MRTMLSDKPIFFNADIINKAMGNEVEVLVRTYKRWKEDLEGMLDEIGLEHSEVETELIGPELFQKEYAKCTMKVRTASDLFAILINMGGPMQICRSDKGWSMEIFVEGDL